MIISLVVVADEKNGIGKNNQLLCHLPADLKYFKALTTGHTILMGRKTFESIAKALPNRKNIVITAQAKEIENCFVFDDIKKGIEFAKSADENELFIIGGESIYKQTLQLADKIYLSKIHFAFDADVFFPELENNWKILKDEKHEADEKNKFDYSFRIYEKTN